jgi:hypothetical protein
LTEIAKAAEGEKDVLEVCVSLRLVLALKGVECRAAARLLARDEAPDEMKQRRFPRPWDIEEINKATFVAVPLLSRTKEVTAICTSQAGYPLPRQIWHEVSHGGLDHSHPQAVYRAVSSIPLVRHRRRCAVSADGSSRPSDAPVLSASRLDSARCSSDNTMCHLTLRGGRRCLSRAQSPRLTACVSACRDVFQKTN